MLEVSLRIIVAKYKFLLQIKKICAKMIISECIPDGYNTDRFRRMSAFSALIRAETGSKPFFFCGQLQIILRRYLIWV